jgi:hypothetical protein
MACRYDSSWPEAVYEAFYRNEIMMSKDRSAIAVLRSGHIKEREYDRERANLRNTYTSSSIEATASCDRALAILLYRSGWTQEQLAKKEGKSRKWVVCQIRFGQFLTFVNSLAELETESLPKNLNTKKFLQIWQQQTVQQERDERMRFQQVLRMMRSGSITAARRPSIGVSIKERFADGQWHSLNAIVKATGANETHVLDTINGMSKNGTYGCKVERKRIGQQIEFRIFKKDKTISVDELTEKLAPIIKELKVEGKKNMATMSPATVAHLAGKLSILLDEWAR